MIFSDPELVALRNVTVTEWHHSARHNSRWIESPERKTWVLDFHRTRPYEIAPVLREPAFLYDLPFVVRFGDSTPSSIPGDPIFTTGNTGGGNVLFALTPHPDVLKLAFYRHDSTLVWSPGIRYDPGRETMLRVLLGEEGIRVNFDGIPVWEDIRPTRLLKHLRVGSSDIGEFARRQFSGSIKLDLPGPSF
jgi:hypothetical protein